MQRCTSEVAVVWRGHSRSLPHADKGHTCERSRNPNGSLSGADRSTARDAAFWDKDDVFR